MSCSADSVPTINFEISSCALQAFFKNNRLFFHPRYANDGLSDPIPLSIGALQGDTLAHYFFFKIIMDYIMRLAVLDDKNNGFEYNKRKSSRQSAQK